MCSGAGDWSATRKQDRGSSQAAALHSSETAVRGSGEAASRKCSNCLRNADSSDAARSRTSAYPSRVIASSSST